MHRLSPHLTWDDAIGREIETEIRRLNADLEQLRPKLSGTVEERLRALPSAALDYSSLADCQYSLGRGEGEVLASLRGSHRTYADYCALVRDRVRARGSEEGTRVNSSFLRNAIFHVLLAKDEAAWPLLLDGTDEVLNAGGLDYGEEFAYVLQTLRLIVTGKPDIAAEAFQDAQAAKKGAWQSYLGQWLSKKARMRFESFQGTLDHPLGAFLANDPTAFARDIEAMCDAFDVHARETMAKGKLNWLGRATSLAWSKEATVYLALARRKGWEVKVDHYAVARSLLDASPATVA